MAASDAGALKARQLQLDKGAFDTDAFILKLVQFMGGRVGKKANIRADSEEVAQERDDELYGPWTKIGRVLARESRRVPALDHMCVLSSSLAPAQPSSVLKPNFRYGPMAILVKEKKAKQARKNAKVNEKDRVRGESVSRRSPCWSLNGF